MKRFIALVIGAFLAFSPVQAIDLTKEHTHGEYTGCVQPVMWVYNMARHGYYVAQVDARNGVLIFVNEWSGSYVSVQFRPMVKYAGDNQTWGGYVWCGKIIEAGTLTR